MRLPDSTRAVEFLDWIRQQKEEAEMYRPMLEPLNGSEIATKYGSEAVTHVNLLVQQVRNLELRNAELMSEQAALISQRDAGWAKQKAVNNELRAKTVRHLERYRRKLAKAQAKGDLSSAAVADQRVKALEALLEG
ncbi:hypothetical protein ACTMTF_15370 [Nonomuraea sp. ZG12]|uniref:hypothetical protein n=1 Tax=Nonomuraea sp. ZG12 TaxID=3452207 RepID=UPI003F8B7663